MLRNRKTMVSRAVAFVIIAIISAGCQSPARLVSQQAQPTYTLLPTYTPYPTHTVVTASPTARPTPTPTMTATPTLAPVSVPDDWQLYTSVSGEFTVYHPNDFKIYNEKSYSISFDKNDGHMLYIGIFDAECTLDSSSDDPAVLKCLAAHLADSTSSAEQIRILRTAQWNGGQMQGYILEESTHSTIYQMTNTAPHYYIKLSNGKELYAMYVNIDADSISPEEQAMAETFIQSFRLGDEPAQRVPPEQDASPQMTSPPTSTPVPTPTATPIPALNIGDSHTIGSFSLKVTEAHIDNQNRYDKLCDVVANPERLGPYVVVTLELIPNTDVTDITIGNQLADFAVVGTSGQTEMLWIVDSMHCENASLALTGESKRFRFPAGQSVKYVLIYQQNTLSGQLYLVLPDGVLVTLITI